jgi:hypothetical protein
MIIVRQEGNELHSGVVMGRRFAGLVMSVVGLALLCAPSAAFAVATGHWRQVTDQSGQNSDEVAVARTADGTLHVVWRRPTPSSPDSNVDLLERPISAGGVLGSTVPVAQGWVVFGNPAIVVVPGGALYVFDGAQHSTVTGDPNSNLSMWASSDGGATWNLSGPDLITGGAADGADVTAAVGPDGTPFFGWGSSTCLCVHRGTSSAPAGNDFQQAEGLGNYGYEPSMAVDPASGQMIIAWYSNGTGHTGMYAATVDPGSGAPASGATLMPSTNVLLDGPFNGRTPIVGRPGGGVYVAYLGHYPNHNQLLLWRVGSPSSSLMAQSGTTEMRSVGVAATPTGRLWIYWIVNNGAGTPIVYARRSNTQATAWGPTVSVTPPPGAVDSWNLVGNGQAGPLDLLGSFSTSLSSSAIATWYTQLLPGLSLSASRTQLPLGARQATKVTFLASDAGTPISGVVVRVGSVHGTTSGKGKVTLALGPFQSRTRLTARAQTNGYVSASVTLTAR